MRRAAKVDSNQPEIVKALRDAGASVQPIYQLGKGVPDLLVGFRGVNLVLEVKDGEKPRSARALTPDEVKWHASWRGQVVVVESVDDALRLLETATARTRLDAYMDGPSLAETLLPPVRRRGRR